MRNQQGFIGVGVLIAILVVLAVLGGGAYYVVQQQASTQTGSEGFDNLQTLPTTNVQTQATTNTPEPTTPAQQSGIFSDLGISFSYPKELAAVKDSFGWSGGRDSGYRVNFGINDTPGATGRMHAFSLRYPCDNCNVEVDSKETLTDVTFNGYQFKKIAVLSTGNPAYPKQGYIKYLYKDSTKNVVLYEFDFHYGAYQDFFADYDRAKTASDTIMGSIKISNYDHSNVYKVLSNQPPVISSFTGATTLAENQISTWKVEVTDSENDKLRYVVRWGDEPSPMDVAYPFNWPSVGSATEYPSTTFTHAYKQAGTYTATVYVVDNDINHVVSKSMVIKVGN